jgi:histidine triad (HIT) family protein
MTDCLFCRMATGALPVEFVADEPETFAIKDIRPQAPVHLLVIPKAHIPTLADVTDAQAPMIAKALSLANRLAKRHGADQGYRVVINCGPQAGQTVGHLHMHVLAGRAMQWPPG